MFLGSIQFLESCMAKITVSGWLSTRCLPQFLTVCWLETTLSSLPSGPPHHDHLFYPSQQGGKPTEKTDATISCNTVLIQSSYALFCDLGTSHNPNNPCPYSRTLGSRDDWEPSSSLSTTVSESETVNFFYYVQWGLTWSSLNHVFYTSKFGIHLQNTSKFGTWS